MVERLTDLGLAVMIWSMIPALWAVTYGIFAGAIR
jgi:hypothetical protein